MNNPYVILVVGMLVGMAVLQLTERTGYLESNCIIESPAYEKVTGR